jgi:hypothetical protein
MTVVPLLRAANAQIEAYMAEHAPGAEPNQGCPPPNAEELKELNRCMSQIGTRMEELQRLWEEASEPELTRYVGNLESLRASLLKAQSELMAKRDLLRQRRDMVQKAMAYTKSYKQTF